MKKIFAIALIISFFLLINTVESVEEKDFSVIYVSRTGAGNFTKITEKSFSSVDSTVFINKKKLIIKAIANNFFK